MRQVAFGQFYDENEIKAKRVEGYLAACLDEGSSPSDSTYALQNVNLRVNILKGFFYLIPSPIEMHDRASQRDF